MKENTQFQLEELFVVDLYNEYQFLIIYPLKRQRVNK